MNNPHPPKPTPPTDDERLRQALLAIRQAFYSAADELGRLYDLERPCKRCDRERRQGARQ